jgi:hypothetical protein
LPPYGSLCINLPNEGFSILARSYINPHSSS